jgi:hypothetical protein
MPQSAIVMLEVCRVSERSAKGEGGVHRKEEVVKPHRKGMCSLPWPRSCKVGALSSMKLFTIVGSGESNRPNGQSAAVDCEQPGRRNNLIEIR